MDPITLVVTAVALGASAGLTDTATTAIKDAYVGLKNLLARRRVDVSSLERKPDSASKQDSLREDLADQPDIIDEEVLEAAQRVVDTIATEQPSAAAAVGVNLRDVRAAFLRIKTVTAAGTGVNVEHGAFSGGIDIGTVRAGTARPEGGEDPSAR